MLVLLLACADPTPEGADTAADIDPLSWAADAPGPFAVGHTSWDVTYTVAGETRTFTAHAWYPTEASEGAPVQYDGFVAADPAVLGDAPPAPPVHDGGYPVLAYSHGDQGWGATSEFLMRHAASHGWVAVAPSHTDNLLWANVDPAPPGHWIHRPRDVSAAVDGLPDAVDGVDLSVFAVAGHSRGGSTVWSVAGAALGGDPAVWCDGCTDEQRAAADTVADPRVVAGIPLDGTMNRSHVGDAGHTSVTAPLLALSAPDRSASHRDQFDTTAGLSLTWVEVADACHQTFALGACETLPTDEGWAIVQTYALAFARRHVLGDTAMDGILDGSTVVDARATLLHHD